MNEIMNVTQMQTPIEIALGIDENGLTTARKLYEFLELRPGDYSRWVKNNILDNGFAEEGVDYWVFRTTAENTQGGRPSQDFKLTSHFAKKLSMTQKNQKGEAARDYFTKVEDGAKKMIMQIQELSPEIQAIFIHDKKIQQVETKLAAVNDELQQFKQELPLFPAEADEIKHKINVKVLALLGGKESNAYKSRSLTMRVYIDIYHELKRQFNVSQYKSIKRNQIDIANKIIVSYTLPYVLAEEIADCNAQINMDTEVA